MQRFFFVPLLAMFLSACAFAQQPGQTDPSTSQAQSQPQPQAQDPSAQPANQDKGPWNRQKPGTPDRDQEAGESSSRDRVVDLSPPKGDEKKHPYSKASVADAEAEAAGSTTDTSDTQEFHPWDPHKAIKDIEVGDYYFKKKNYRAALDRYKEALYYKNNDAMATLRMAQCQEKLGQPEDALANYQGYLRILPHGPYAEEAQKSIAKLKAQSETPGPTAKK